MIAALALGALVTVLAAGAAPAGGSAELLELVEVVEPLPPLDQTPEGATEPAGAALDALLRARRSVRAFAPDSLDTATLGWILWAACGITEQAGFARRAAPSAGALYPLEIDVVTARGIARYDPRGHALRWRRAGDQRAQLGAAALRQPWVSAAPATLVIGAVPQRTRVKYGERADRYVWIEAGCAAQNALLAAVARGLGAVVVGAFDDAAVAGLLGYAGGLHPLLLIPIGRPAAPPGPAAGPGR